MEDVPVDRRVAAGRQWFRLTDMPKQNRHRCRSRTRDKPPGQGLAVCVREHEGRRFKFFENDRFVAVCGGIGAQAARRACEAMIFLYEPSLVISAGFAGALHPAIEPGSAFTPRTVIDARDGSRTDVGSGTGTLVSVGSMVGHEQKMNMAKSYGAQAVGYGSGRRGKRCGSSQCSLQRNESDLRWGRLRPCRRMDRFVGHDGQFHTAKLAAYVAVRPWLWERSGSLRRDSSHASKSTVQVVAVHQRRKTRNQLSSFGATANH